MEPKPRGCILVAAGGTGGHVIPALEVARTLRGRGWECVFVGTPRGLENRLVPAADFALERIGAGSLNRVSARRRLGTLLQAPGALAAALDLVRRRGPAAVLSLGGSVSGPLAVACAVLGVPLVALEPNACPGLANRLAAPVARKALLGHPQAAKYFHAASCSVTGLPVRREFFRVPRRPPGTRLAVLVLGGSRGAARLNQAAVGAARIWRREGVQPPQVTHQTGPEDLERTAAAYRELGSDAEAAAFFNDLPERYARTDLAICRAGASATAELCAARLPAVLVPFPYATDDHQTANARVLAEAGGALLVRDRDWTGERMAQEIAGLAAHPARLEAMAAALAPLAPAGATERAADMVEEAAAQGGS